MIDISENITTIEPKKSLFDLKLKEIWAYRDLLFLFVKRDITVIYKQTIFGPLWFIIQPLITTIMFLVVFNGIAGISTDGIPPIVFYLAGITIWNYFAESLRLTSDTFVKNTAIFGKVYFPRVIMPISVVISTLVKFIIQFCLFLIVYLFYFFTTETLSPNITLFLIPAYIIIIGFLTLGFGLAISAITTKYRDLTFLVQFGIQLWMYATPVIYPVSKIPEQYQVYVMLNPVAPIVEAFKYAFTGSGSFLPGALLYSATFAILFFVFSLAIFNRTEKSFMDTV